MESARFSSALASSALLLVALFGLPTFASAQPFAYVVGQRDDPAPGNSGIQVLSVLDLSTSTRVASIPLGLSCLCVNPEGVAISPDGRRVYVSNLVANLVSVIDTATNTVIATIPSPDGSGPNGLTVSPDGTRVYVVNGWGINFLSVIDATTNTVVANIPLGVAQANGVAVSPDGARLYVSTYGANSVRVIDTGSLGIVTTVAVANLAVGVDITPDGSLVHVAAFSSNAVSVINTSTNAVVATIPVGTGPSSSRITPDGLRAYVANSQSNTISVINTQTNSVVGSPIPVTFNPRTLAFTPDGARAVVANSANVQIIDTASNTVTGTIAFNPADHGSPAAVAITPASASAPTMTLDRTSLRFAAVTSGATFLSQTSPQVVRLTQSGPPGTVTWTATANQPWLTVSPGSGTGPAELSVGVVPAGGLPGSGAVTGSITLAFTGAGSLAAPISVGLRTFASGTSAPPFGVVDTPVDNSTGVSGAVPFTGWALDDIEVDGVTVCRAAVTGESAPVDRRCAGAAQIFIGDAVFIEGARPDVQVTFLTHPRSSRAGWGFMVLTNMLPDVARGLPTGGNGTYTFFLYARDREGHASLLGTRTLACDNEHGTLPFGTIDTPGQGGVVSGSEYVNFGWALTPQPKFVPTDGSTITVFIDGVAVGNVSYDHFRLDIAGFFPGLANSNGPVGFRIIDTTTLSNGVHTIAWGVTDSAGAAQGLGSRYFTVSNGVAAASGSVSGFSRTHAVVSGFSRTSEVDAVPLDRTPLRGRRGWDLESAWRQYLVGGTGRATVRGEELDRFELQLTQTARAKYAGYLRIGADLAPLPLGSHLNAGTGVFTWQPGVGFIGTYDLVFVRSTGGRAVARQDVRIVLAAKGSGRLGPQVVIDTPSPVESRFSRTDAEQPFMLAGWAADLDADDGTGIDTVHVGAYPVNGAAPIFLGVADAGGTRPDVAAVHGEQFRDSGYGLIVQGLAPGSYDLAVFASSRVTGKFVPARVVRVTVR